MMMNRKNYHYDHHEYRQEEEGRGGPRLMKARRPLSS